MQTEAACDNQSWGSQPAPAAVIVERKAGASPNDGCVAAANPDQGERVGDYELIEPIGRGTFSEVFLASRVTNGISKVRFAIKRLHRTNSPDRIHNELVLVDCLGSKPGSPVVKLMDAFRVDDAVMLVQEHIEHSDFKQRLMQNSLEDTTEYLRALFQTLKFLHSFKVMHRDIKPSNFLYSFKTRQFKLVDFGLAHIVGQYSDEEHRVDGLNRWMREFGFRGASAVQSAPCVPQFRRGEAAGRQSRHAAAGNKRRHADSSAGAGSPDRVGTLAPGKIQRVQRDAMLNSRNRRQPAKQGAAVRCSEARRGGTRGYRAPEVLLGCTNEQTTAIDVWSAGVIMLQILSCRYPFFRAEDDARAFAELAEITPIADLQRAVCETPCYRTCRRIVKPKTTLYAKMVAGSRGA
jgi:cell division control protein 7